LPKKHIKDIKALGRHIDKIRIEKGYSIREFASLCEISKSQVNELGNKGIDFRYSTLIKVAKGLEIPLSELLNF
jgi:transcriptional regulator with XRE-family HTH domain